MAASTIMMSSFSPLGGSREVLLMVSLLYLTLNTVTQSVVGWWWGGGVLPTQGTWGQEKEIMVAGLPVDWRLCFNTWSSMSSAELLPWQWPLIDCIVLI